jgi:hypothetical protein
MTSECYKYGTDKGICNPIINLHITLIELGIIPRGGLNFFGNIKVVANNHKSYLLCQSFRGITDRPADLEKINV